MAMDKFRFYAGLAIMAGLIFAGAMLPSAVREFKAGERVVNVKGLCEREVKADKVIWPIRFKVVGNDLKGIYDGIENGNRIIGAFLTEGGIDSSQFSVSLPSVSDRDAQEYGSNERNFRYIATGTIVVCTAEVDKVLELMSDQGELIAKGISVEQGWDSKPKFSFENLNGIKPEMIQAATCNAREAALKFAADSQSNLGKIKNACQGSFSIEDRDEFTPQIKKVRVVTSVSYYLKK